MSFPSGPFPSLQVVLFRLLQFAHPLCGSRGFCLPTAWACEAESEVRSIAAKCSRCEVDEVEPDLGLREAVAVVVEVEVEVEGAPVGGRGRSDCQCCEDGSAAVDVSSGSFGTGCCC